jgi:hypothetical protein
MSMSTSSRRARRLFPLLVAGFVLSIGGAAVADTPPAPEQIQATDFDTQDSQLAGFQTRPAGRVLAFFSHARTTQHLVSVGDNGTVIHPPSPCRGLTLVWNFAITRNLPRSIRMVLLQRMAERQCFMDVTTDETTTPPTLISVRPRD